MIEYLILGRVAPDELLKSEKKRASSNENISGLTLKLYLCNFSAASEAISALKKHKHLVLSPEFKVLNAYYYICTSQYKEASEVLCELSLPNVKCDKALVSHMKVLVLLGQRLYNEAKVFLSTLERTEQVSLKSVYCCLKLNDYQSAKDIIKDHKANFPGPSLYFKVYSLIIKQNYAKALGVLEGQHPDESFKEDYQILRAFLYLRLDQLTQASGVLTEVLEANNKSETAWHLVSVLYYKLELYSDCFWSISKCLHFHPESPEYLLNLSKLYVKTQSFGIAKGLCDKAKKIDAGLSVQEEFFYPVLDFSEFGNRRKCWVPVRVNLREQIFVKPVAKKVSAQRNKKKRKMVEAEAEAEVGLGVGKEENEFDPAWALESLKKGTSPDWIGQSMGNKNGFVPSFYGNR